MTRDSSMHGGIVGSSEMEFDLVSARSKERSIRLFDDDYGE